MKAIDRTFKAGDKVMVRKDIQRLYNAVSSFMAQRAGEVVVVTYVTSGDRYELNDMEGNYLGSGWRNIDLIPLDNDDV